ncbi:type II toxin-antitoxin system VapC family toxin [Tistrella mobilis]|uniref:type II toxin-antitoxin system VapC family toxin n=1 Tax=Tistrella mobilis TaxID=171437 RepID=UPI0035585305
MSLVLDGSVVLAWCFDDEVTPAIDDLMRHVARNGAVVPAIWHLEVANGLRTALRKQRLTTGRRDELMDILKLLPIEPDTETARTAWEKTLQLSDKHGLTPYDASYVELALRRALPIATLDQAMCNAAPACSVDVIGLSSRSAGV